MADTEEMTLEELESAMERAALDPTQPLEEVEVEETEPAPEPEVEEVAQADEPVEAEAEQVEAEATEQPTDEESAEPDPAELEREEYQSRIAEFEARAKHWEQVAGRHGQEIGALRRQLQSFGQEAPAQPASDEDYGEQTRVAPTRPNGSTTGRDQIASWAIGQAINAGASEFFAKHEDASGFREEIGQYLQAIDYKADNALLTDNPIEAQRETSRVLEEAYWHVKATAEAARREQLAAKRAEQTRSMTEAKKKASISATASAPSPKPKQKGVEDMNLDELDKALKEAASGYW